MAMQETGTKKNSFKEEQKYAALVCQADETHFLVNGSTGGILSAVFSAAEHNDTILMARNCRKQVYDAAELRRLKIRCLYPEILPEGILGEVSPAMVEEALENCPEAKMLILTSPTRAGVVSDIRSIVKLAHAKGVTVVVDESLGGHFLKESGFPKSAVRQGADVVIQGPVRSLPELEQTALLHIHGDYRYKEKVRKYLKMFQTAEPSALLMKSIGDSMQWYMEEGRTAYKKYLERLKKFRAACSIQLNYLKPVTPETAFAHDISKIVISVKKCSITGEALAKEISKRCQRLPLFMSEELLCYQIAVDDSEEEYLKLLDALAEMDGSLEPASVVGNEPLDFGRRKVLVPIFKAVEQKKKAIPLPESMGEASGAYVTIYPPGMPLLVPGEKISERCVRILQRYLEAGMKIDGLTKEQEIEILWEEYFT